MNFYKHHIGDYDADTAHLSMLEDAAYSRLMRAYYRTESPIPADIKQACRLVRANSKAEREAVAVVLNEFFALGDDGWHNKRCDEELASYTKQAETNRAIAVAREAKRKRHDSCNDSSSFREPNQNPESISQNPEIKTNINNTPVVIPSTATAVCVALRSAGIGQVNPQHPDLIELISKGATIGDFETAGKTAVDRGKGFGYALGIVRNDLANRERLLNFARKPSATMESIMVLERMKNAP